MGHLRRRSRRAILALAILAGGLAIPAAARADPAWTMVWDDEFTGAAGALPDSTRWAYDLGGGGWGNGELETYTDSTSNVYQTGSGGLVIQALDNGGYTSARIKTQALFDQAYGMVEASIELPAGTTEGSGLWPAFWMLGSNINSVSWPACGEIDMMENIGQYNTNTQNGGHIHGPVEPGGGDYNGGDGVGAIYTLPAGQAMNTGFHVYGVQWSPTSISYFVDGTVYQTLSAAGLPAGGQWVFNHPFFIILNLAVGGPIGGAVACSFPQQMQVQWVRVYKATDNGTGPYGGTAPSLPGVIQAANYDTYDDATDPTEPGEGFAYNALNPTNTSGQYRAGDAISMENCTDSSSLNGGYDCDYTSPGQWMQYTVNVTQAGGYTFDARVASDETGGTFHFDVDGTEVGGELTAPNTGGWQNWTDVTEGGIALTAGQHVILLDEDSMIPGGLGVCNFNYLQFSLVTPTAVATSSPSAVPTATSTPSATPTSTRTFTPSDTPPFTKSASPSSTVSPSETPTGTPSATRTASPTASVTPSYTESAGPSATQSPSGTPTATLSGTVSPSDTSTPTSSPTEPATASPISTASATQSQTPTATFTATRSPTEPASPTLKPTASPTATETSSLTASPVPSAPQAAPGSGPLAVQGVFPVPNPNPNSLAVELNGPADAVNVRVFTKALVLALEFSRPGLAAGWQRISVPGGWQNLPSGLYYVQVQAIRGQAVSRAVVTRAMVLK
jgi:beta-glucanase (GH16 family)